MVRTFRPTAGRPDRLGFRDPVQSPFFATPAGTGSIVPYKVPSAASPSGSSAISAPGYKPPSAPSKGVEDDNSNQSSDIGRHPKPVNGNPVLSPDRPTTGRPDLGDYRPIHGVGHQSYRQPASSDPDAFDRWAGAVLADYAQAGHGPEDPRASWLQYASPEGPYGPLGAIPAQDLLAAGNRDRERRGLPPLNIDGSVFNPARPGAVPVLSAPRPRPPKDFDPWPTSPDYSPSLRDPFAPIPLPIDFNPFDPGSVGGSIDFGAPAFQPSVLYLIRADASNVPASYQPWSFTVSAPAGLTPSTQKNSAGGYNCLLGGSVVAGWGNSDTDRQNYVPNFVLVNTSPIPGLPGRDPSVTSVPRMPRPGYINSPSGPGSPAPSPAPEPSPAPRSPLPSVPRLPTLDPGNFPIYPSAPAPAPVPAPFPAKPSSPTKSPSPAPSPVPTPWISPNTGTPSNPSQPIGAPVPPSDGSTGGGDDQPGNGPRCRYQVDQIVSATVKKFTRCGESGPEFQEEVIPVHFAMKSAIVAAFDRLYEIESAKCDPCDCHAAIPESWQLRIDQRPPQLVIQYAEVKADGKFGPPNYSLSVPFYRYTEEQTNKALFPAYKKGSRSGILVLSNNSKIVVNAHSEIQASIVIEALRKLVKPERLEGAILSNLSRKGQKLKEIQVVPKIAKYFDGENEKPLWIKYF